MKKFIIPIIVIIALGIFIYFVFINEKPQKVEDSLVEESLVESEAFETPSEEEIERNLNIFKNAFLDKGSATCDFINPVEEVKFTMYIQEGKFKLFGVFGENEVYSLFKEDNIYSWSNEEYINGMGTVMSVKELDNEDFTGSIFENINNKEKFSEDIKIYLRDCKDSLTETNAFDLPEDVEFYTLEEFMEKVYESDNNLDLE